MDPKFSLVTHILLDPSCSGSGIVNRLDYLVPTAAKDGESGVGEEEEEEGGEEQERLDKLAGFQTLMIRHAMKCKHHLNVTSSFLLTHCQRSPSNTTDLILDLLGSSNRE